MKTFLIINTIIGLLDFMFLWVVIIMTRTNFRKDYPTAKLNKTPLFNRIYVTIAAFITGFIPIYNIILLLSYLFSMNELVKNGYEILVNRIIEE